MCIADSTFFYYQIFHFFINIEGQTLPVDIATLASLVDEVWDKDCEPLSQHCSTEWVVIPEQPTMFGFFQFVYLTNRSVNQFKESAVPDFVCFDGQKCPISLATIVTIKIINGLTCCHTSNLTDNVEYMDFDELLATFSVISRACWRTGMEKACINSSYFHCNQSSKCIPNHRVRDGTIDCLHSEDELFDACQLYDSNRFICESDQNICLQPVALGNGFEECPLGEDEAYTYARDSVKLVPFTVLCDSFDDYRGFSMSHVHNSLISHPTAKIVPIKREQERAYIAKCGFSLFIFSFFSSLR
jgi:hypothetical protein